MYNKKIENLILFSETEWLTVLFIIIIVIIM